MLALRLETWDEARMILAFHVTGTMMELFKTAAGSWTYPEPSVLRIGDVPLFSGFMYAAVGSYLARVWRIFNFRFTHFPPLWIAVALAVAIYVNFFAHHWLPDMRIALFAITALLFWRCTVWFTPWRTARRMPLLLGWLLAAQAWRMISADDHLVRSRGAGASAEAARSRRAGTGLTAALPIGRGSHRSRRRQARACVARPGPCAR